MAEQLTDQEIKDACVEPPKETQNFYIHEIAIETKDPRKSLKFYTEVLGMRLLYRAEFPSSSASYFYLGYENDGENVPKKTFKEKLEWEMGNKVCVELEHYYGRHDDDTKTERPIGHIGISVPDIVATYERMVELGVPIVKDSKEGEYGIYYIFVEDPDGNIVEIAGRK